MATMASMYVPCPERISSPAPSDGALAMGIRPNMVCGAKVPVERDDAVMELRCPYGHTFFAAPPMVVRD